MILRNDELASKLLSRGIVGHNTIFRDIIDKILKKAKNIISYKRFRRKGLTNILYNM